ncbi:unnamed protein product, partial [Arabidopsis halleri]
MHFILQINVLALLLSCTTFCFFYRPFSWNLYYINMYVFVSIVSEKVK